MSQGNSTFFCMVGRRWTTDNPPRKTHVNSTDIKPVSRQNYCYGHWLVIDSSSYEHMNRHWVVVELEVCTWVCVPKIAATDELVLIAQHKKVKWYGHSIRKLCRFPKGSEKLMLQNTSPQSTCTKFFDCHKFKTCAYTYQTQDPDE